MGRFDVDFQPCPRNPEHTIVPTYRGCFGCDTERQMLVYQRALKAEREERIEDAVEIARRIIPILVEALRKYDEESRQ